MYTYAYIYIYIYIYIYSDVNDAGLFNAEPRLLVIDAEPRFLFLEKKLTRVEPLSKRARDELRFLQNIIKLK